MGCVYPAGDADDADDGPGGGYSAPASAASPSPVWGGIGGVDGRGGLGYGVLYCVDRSWWGGWESYSGWSWGGDDGGGAAAPASAPAPAGGPPLMRDRPHELSTEPLLDRTSDFCVAGTLGSYEVMRVDVRAGEDYVLVPPGVWDVLYELYGGGPPLPRMVLPPPEEGRENGEGGGGGGGGGMRRVKVSAGAADEGTIEVSYASTAEDAARSKPSSPALGGSGGGAPGAIALPPSPPRLPPALGVSTHPWVLHCHACDPRQPYRRGDAGPVSLRVMAGPDQPLWRLFGEICSRLPVPHPKARDGRGRGRARLWKRIDPPPAGGRDGGGAGGGGGAGSAAAAGITRYGPWVLLCKSRWAPFPARGGADDAGPSEGGGGGGGGENHPLTRDLLDEWLAYTDHASCESSGLGDGMRIMFEYALVGKDGNFAWPREAAAKAGRMRRLADEDAGFRRTLRGLDSQGRLVKAAGGGSPLIGKVVDAMDTSGRWYQAEIVGVDRRGIHPDDEDDEDGGEDDADDGRDEDDDDDGDGGTGENKAVRVDFSEVGGHEEWIDVRSDRLAVAGRFTLDSMKNMDAGPSDGVGAAAGGPSSSDGARAKALAAANRSKAGGSTAQHSSSAGDINSGGAICSFPGYGACGLTNLGNTCYANSALQCLSYAPLLRSYLLSGQYKLSGDLNKDNPLGTGGKLLEEFVDLLRVMWSGKHGVRAPSRFRAQLGKARSQYAGGDQQDAQELLNDMLDALHEDSNKVKKKPYVEALEDDWVKHTPLPRVGTEAWRRFLRRNRSVIANTAMGQVLNRVTCPVCQHESRNFDPFNMLSIPFPTVAEVIFRCRVVRRGTALNCPASLGRGRRIVRIGEDGRDAGATGGATPGDRDGAEADDEEEEEAPSPPSDRLVVEEYIIPMSRLADIGDLKLRLQNISGIPTGRLKLCKAEEMIVSADLPDHSPVRTYVKVTALPDKEGPCIQLAKQPSASGVTSAGGEDVSAPAVAPTQIVAFESTLCPRPPRPSPPPDDKKAGSEEGTASDASTADEDESEEGTGGGADAGGRSSRGVTGSGGAPGGSSGLFTPQQRRVLREQLRYYGDADECRLVDTNPTPLSKAMSRSLWPRVADDFKLGLRVDAIDHRNHWFPGSVVEIIEGIDDSEEDEEPPTSSRRDDGRGGSDDSPPVKTKVRIHFDNFSSKWDETYTIDHFKRGRVRPLYSHAPPRPKPTEFLVHHRHRAAKGNALFGQPFYLQCHNEWSTARAGAQILAQAARFLQPPSRPGGGSENGSEESGSRVSITARALEHACAVVSQIVEMLVESDRAYVESALTTAGDPYLGPYADGDGGSGSGGGGGGGERAAAAAAAAVPSLAPRPFNASSMSSRLSKKLGALLPQLPFDVRVCTADSPLGGQHGSSSDEVAFPFSLVRTIGNYMNARHAVVLHWKDRSGDPPRTSSGKHRPSALRHPLIYAGPAVGVHERSWALLRGGKDGEEPPPGVGASAKEGGPPVPPQPRKNVPGHGGMRIGVCLNEFCKEQHLPATDNWRCPKCKEVREGRQHMILWRLPDILVFHLKRFNCSARWREKITTKVNFPLTGLNMSEWCDSDSPALDSPDESCVYDLIGVVNHYGGMTGGHYVATCKATACSADGSEEVAYNFNGAGISAFDAEEETVQTGWRLGRSKEKDAATAQTKAAAAAARSAAESAEPLWLQFDDDLVEPIPPRNVVSEMAYVLFYRRRRISPSNIVKYSTLE